MTVCVYYPKENQEHTDTLGAMAEGIPGAQYRPVESYRAKEAPDVAVVFGMYKKAVPYSAFRGRIFEVQKYLGKKTLVLEKGYVKRDQYYAVGWGGLNGRADFRNIGMPADRAELLGVEMKPWNLDGSYYLIAGQIPWDASVEHTEFFKWVALILRRVQGIVKDPVVFRPHPLMQGDATELYEEMEKHGVTIDTDSLLEDALAGAKAVITFNSNVGVDALIAGKPVLSFDEGSMAYSASKHHVEYLLDPGLIIARLNREQWFNDLAYAQWTRAEMEKGVAWGHISKDLELEKAA